MWRGCCGAGHPLPSQGGCGHPALPRAAPAAPCAPPPQVLPPLGAPPRSARAPQHQTTGALQPLGRVALQGAPVGRGPCQNPSHPHPGAVSPTPQLGPTAPQGTDPAPSISSELPGGAECGAPVPAARRRGEGQRVLGEESLPAGGRSSAGPVPPARRATPVPCPQPFGHPGTVWGGDLGASPCPRRLRPPGDLPAPPRALQPAN